MNQEQFAGYDDFGEAIEANSEKADTKAYAAAIHYEATGEWPGEKAADVFDDREEHLEALLTAARKLDVEPDEAFLADIREKAGYGTADDGRTESGGVIDRLLSWGRSG